MRRKIQETTDTLDVWFDSARRMKTGLNRCSTRVPCDLYLEGSDQHRGCFQSSLLTVVLSTAARLTKHCSRMVLWWMAMRKRASQKEMSCSTEGKDTRGRIFFAFGWLLPTIPRTVDTDEFEAGGGKL